MYDLNPLYYASFKKTGTHSPHLRSEPNPNAAKDASHDDQSCYRQIQCVRHPHPHIVFFNHLCNIKMKMKNARTHSSS